MENQEAIYFLIMIALVLGIGNSYYIAKHLLGVRATRTRTKTGFEESSPTDKNSDKTTNIKD